MNLVAASLILMAVILAAGLVTCFILDMAVAVFLWLWR